MSNEWDQETRETPKKWHITLSCIVHSNDLTMVKLNVNGCVNCEVQLVMNVIGSSCHNSQVAQPLEEGTQAQAQEGQEEEEAQEAVSLAVAVAARRPRRRQLRRGAEKVFGAQEQAQERKRQQVSEQNCIGSIL